MIITDCFKFDTVVDSGQVQEKVTLCNECAQECMLVAGAVRSLGNKCPMHRTKRVHFYLEQKLRNILEKFASREKAGTKIRMRIQLEK